MHVTPGRSWLTLFRWPSSRTSLLNTTPQTVEQQTLLSSEKPSRQLQEEHSRKTLTTITDHHHFHHEKVLQELEGWVKKFGQDHRFATETGDNHTWDPEGNPNYWHHPPAHAPISGLVALAGAHICALNKPSLVSCPKWGFHATKCAIAMISEVDPVNMHHSTLCTEV